MLLLSLVSIALILGHLIAILANRSFWPFDNYPMYSFPLDRLRFPILLGKKLYMITLVDVTNAEPRDILFGPNLRPKEIHPLSRLDLVLLMLKAGLMNNIYMQIGERHDKHFGWDFRQSAHDIGDAEKKETLRNILQHIQTQNADLKKLQFLIIEWEDIWSVDVDPKHPDLTWDFYTVTND